MCALTLGTAARIRKDANVNAMSVVALRRMAMTWRASERVVVHTAQRAE
jgi:hypothetical protein